MCLFLNPKYKHTMKIYQKSIIAIITLSFLAVGITMAQTKKYGVRKNQYETNKNNPSPSINTTEVKKTEQNANQKNTTSKEASKEVQADTTMPKSMYKGPLRPPSKYLDI